MIYVYHGIDHLWHHKLCNLYVIMIFNNNIDIPIYESHEIMFISGLDWWACWSWVNTHTNISSFLLWLKLLQLCLACTFNSLLKKFVKPVHLTCINMSTFWCLKRSNRHWKQYIFVIVYCNVFVMLLQYFVLNNLTIGEMKWVKIKWLGPISTVVMNIIF